jgi:thiamine biosynthesis lipoprotein
VIAANVLTADVLTTALLAGGRPTLDTVTDRFDIHVLAVDSDGQLLGTEQLRQQLSRSEAFHL